MRIRKAIFPVAGLGTRFLPATKVIPKEMLTLLDKPLIQYAVEEAQDAGIEEFIFVTGKGKTAIEDHFDHSQELENIFKQRKKDEELEELASLIPPSGRYFYTRQLQPLGLGHAIWCARRLIGDEPFAVLLADDVIMGSITCLEQMLKAYQNVGGNIIAIMDVPLEHTSRYGIINGKTREDHLIEVKSMVEKPSPNKAPSNMAIVGRYILQPEVFTHLEQQQMGAGGEIQLTDALIPMIQNHPFHGFRFQGKRFDCGEKLGLLKATIKVALSRPELCGELLNELQQILKEYLKSEV